MKAGLTRRAVAAGFSLIELLVAMVIALVITLAITSVMVRTGSDRRSTASVNDLNQTGTYISYVLDRAARNAGSGFSQKSVTDGTDDHLGCLLNVSRAGAQVLPRPAAFPASSAFANVPVQTRLLPILIGKNLADSGTDIRGDVLTLMSGTAGYGELPQPVLQDAVTSTVSKRLQNVVGYRANDLVLLALATPLGGCMVQQISAVAAQTLTFGGTYFNASGSTVALGDFNGGTSVALQLGSAPNNPPQMQLYGVGDNATLFSYDLLQQAGDVTVPIADGVVEMHAIYGVDTTTPAADGTLDTWVDPVAGSGYTPADLTAGTAVAQARLRRIVAVRIGLIRRTSLLERDPVVPAGTALTLFADLGASAPTRTLSTAERNFRFRTLEFTVPLRNSVFAP